MKMNKERKPYVRPALSIFALKKCGLLTHSIDIKIHEDEEEDEDNIMRIYQLDNQIFG